MVDGDGRRAGRTLRRGRRRRPCSAGAVDAARGIARAGHVRPQRAHRHGCEIGGPARRHPRRPRSVLGFVAQQVRARRPQARSAAERARRVGDGERARRRDAGAAPLPADRRAQSARDVSDRRTVPSSPQVELHRRRPRRRRRPHRGTGSVPRSAHPLDDSSADTAMLANLFRSLDIGPVSLHCRIVSTAHQTTLARDHVVTPELLAYQEARARGGVGLIIRGAAAPEPAGLLSDEMMAGYLPRTIDGYREMKRITEPYGTKVFVQLFHGGREQFGSGPRREIVSSGAVPSLRYHSEPRAMTTAEVEQVIESFARCAAIAAEGGLDGIEVSAAHNYLPAQFFTAETNHRNDRFAVPERFLLESIRAVREAAPALAVGVRLTATAPAAQHVALAIAAEVDFFHVTTGDSATYVGGALIVPPPPWPHNIVIDHTKPFVELGPAVIATGRIVDAAEADAFIAAGKADAVGMNRALITDPDMPAKARRGDLDAVMRCIGCNVCIEHYHALAPIACAQNPRTGRELHMSRPVAARDPKRVVFVGGGPAGLSAAAEAAAAGHHVVLYEARERLRGQMSLAGNAPRHAELAASMRRNFEHLLDRPNVQIRLALAADVRAVREVGADCVVIATGARPYSAQYELQAVEVQGVEVQGVEVQGVELQGVD